MCSVCVCLSHAYFDSAQVCSSNSNSNNKCKSYYYDYYNYCCFLFFSALLLTSFSLSLHYSAYFFCDSIHQLTDHGHTHTRTYTTNHQLLVTQQQQLLAASRLATFYYYYYYHPFKLIIRSWSRHPNSYDYNNDGGGGHY